MFQYKFIIAQLSLLAMLAGCNDPELQPQSARRTPLVQTKSPETGESTPKARAFTSLECEDILQEVREVNRKAAMPSGEFRAGHAQPLKLEKDRIKKNDDGFVIELPSESPIPTPTIYQGRVFVSGGFSSMEYYCFDALSGEFVWGATLDDDGPSSAVAYDDSIIFGTESCTVFALKSETGKLKWAHWLGDPLLSTPTVANGKVFLVYPAADNDPGHFDGATEEDEPESRPSHIAAAFDADKGKLLWRRWIDSDCMTYPVAVGDEVYVTSLAGTLYIFGQEDGSVRFAAKPRATSAPLIVGDKMFLTRRADGNDDKTVVECIVAHDRASQALQFVAASRPAPYLDQDVQMRSKYSKEADSFEAPNGIGGGGFGGGFGGGSFSVQDNIADTSEQEKSDEPDEAAENTNQLQQPTDALGVTELQAAGNIGLGNVSTLQCYHGSRLTCLGNHLYNCMGDQLVCTRTKDGKVLWSTKLAGDLEKIGGHLASPPIVAGDSLLLTKVSGQILQVDADTGETTRTFDIGSPVRFPPVVHRGRVYVGTQDGKLVCINTGDQQLTGWPMTGKDSGHGNVASTHGVSDHE